jgi:hypothetical protein
VEVGDLDVGGQPGTVPAVIEGIVQRLEDPHHAAKVAIEQVTDAISPIR